MALLTTTFGEFMDAPETLIFEDYHIRPEKGLNRDQGSFRMPPSVVQHLIVQ
jgi:hypothetical protein